MEKKKEYKKNNNNNNSIKILTEISQPKNLQYLFGKENKKIYIGIIIYLEYKDIINFQLVNKYFYSVLSSKITLKIYALKKYTISEMPKDSYCVSSKLRLVHCLNLALRLLNA